MATISIIFLRINVPNIVQFTKQRQYGQYKATQEIRPVGGKAHPKLKAFGHNPARQANSITTAITTMQCYVEIVTVMLGLTGPTNS